MNEKGGVVKMMKIKSCNRTNALDTFPVINIFFLSWTTSLSDLETKTFLKMYSKYRKQQYQSDNHYLPLWQSEWLSPPYLRWVEEVIGKKVFDSKL